MPSSAASGSLTATGSGTEDALGSAITTAGVYVLTCDLNDLANGETVEVRAKVKVRSTGTTRELYIGSYSHAQAQPNIASIPVPSLHECSFSITQIAGTGVVIPWEVVRLDA